eukprot:3146454-Rhodomonas_salina.3
MSLSPMRSSLDLASLACGACLGPSKDICVETQPSHPSKLEGLGRCSGGFLSGAWPERGGWEQAGRDLRYVPCSSTLWTFSGARYFGVWAKTFLLNRMQAGCLARERSESLCPATDHHASDSA